MEFDILNPHLTLDEWQKEFIKEKGNCFVLCGRQSGKSTCASIKAVEMAVNHHKKGEDILIIAFTERQAYNLYSKCLDYALKRYKHLIKQGKDKPTKHEFTINGVKIMCHPTGLQGEGLRGFTIKRLIIDECAVMNDAIFTAVMPMLSVTGGSVDLLSTPRGKQGYFYAASLRDDFKKFYISAEDCPRHNKEFLEAEKSRMSKLEYAQEYLAVFLDDLQRLFPDSLIDEVCILKRTSIRPHRYYLGVDVAGLGKDLSTFEVVEKVNKDKYEQRENIYTKMQYTTQTVKRIKDLDDLYSFKKIGVDDGGIGFGVFSELLVDDKTKKKVVSLNNSSRPLDKDKEKSTKLLKEHMYFNLLSLMETKKLKLLDDDEIKASLMSVQFEIIEEAGKKTEWRIFGNNTHIVEGIIRAVWLATQDKSLNIWCAFN